MHPFDRPTPVTLSAAWAMKFTHPETKKVEPKAMYCERLDETGVCGGIYR
jgi:hypothetical protein